MRWTEDDLDRASPETIGRLRWLIDAERLARTAAKMEAIVSEALPRGADHQMIASVQGRRVQAADLLRTIDGYLGVAEEAEPAEGPPDG